MFKQKKNFLWTEELLYQYKILASGEALKKISQQFIGQDVSNSFKINTSYPLIHNLGGVTIEIGELIIQPINLEKILHLLQSFVIPSTNTSQTYEIHQNIDILIEWAQENKVEIPNKISCEGYIFNNELISFRELDNVMTLEFKYKESPYNPFLLYRLAFFATKQKYFLFKGKYF